MRFLNSRGTEAHVFFTGKPMTVRISYHASGRIERPVFGVAIYRSDGIHINGPNTRFAGLDIPFIEGDGEVDYVIESLPLLAGSYDFSASIYDYDCLRAYDHHHRAHKFLVQNGAVKEQYGMVYAPSHWELVGEMSEPTPDHGPYDAYYYAHDCGRPYQRDDLWLGFFGEIADQIVRQIGPGSVLDAGCAMGFLVESLRDRGVDAFGIDISPYAIERVRPDIRPFCRVASITEPLDRRYDLIVCIEVFEHLSPAEAEAAVANLCGHTDDVLFSSTPEDLKEVTHVNVRPPEHWAEMFARHGFYRDVDLDGGFITPWAARFRRSGEPVHRLVRDYERRLWMLQQEARARRLYNIEQRDELARGESTVQALSANLADREAAIESLNARVSDQETQVRALNSLLAESESAAQASAAQARQLAADWQIVKSTTTWRLVQGLVAVRRFLVPVNSRREHVLYLVRRGLHVLRTSGPRPFLSRAQRRLSLSLTTAYRRVRPRPAPGQTTKLITVEAVDARPPAPPHTVPVAVVVCVHNALADVTRCLESVRQHTGQPYSLILVDDGSDAETRDLLAAFSEANGATLLRNEVAAGYTRAANQGLRRADTEYVVLLNSDTVVTPGWLDRLVACAESDPSLAAVGPLSNTASWQSIPEIESQGDWAGNPLPEGMTVAEMGGLSTSTRAACIPRCRC